jgi:hypothetical protein
MLHHYYDLFDSFLATVQHMPDFPIPMPLMSFQLRLHYTPYTYSQVTWSPFHTRHQHRPLNNISKSDFNTQHILFITNAEP